LNRSRAANISSPKCKPHTVPVQFNWQTCGNSLAAEMRVSKKSGPVELRIYVIEPKQSYVKRVLQGVALWLADRVASPTEQWLESGSDSPKRD